MICRARHVEYGWSRDVKRSQGMKTLISTLALLGVLVFGAESASAASAAYCDGYARNYANNKAGANAIGSAVVGGIGGALLGGIIGGKHGAGTGAVIGGVGGLAVGGSQWQRYYDQAYYGCVNSGPPQQPPPPPQYVVGPGCAPPEYIVPQDWYQQCSYKYKSFSWDGPFAGDYKGFDGCWHACKLP
jgi:hypothetical protein